MDGENKPPRKGSPLIASRKARTTAPAGFLTYQQAADRLGVGTVRWVEKLVARGELGVFRPAPRCPFITEDSLADYIRRRTTPPRPLRGPAQRR